ncbi:transposase [Deinococcus radiopugnans]|uniref:transposase n=1 Tax=Deinococcus radiopugnans TaxID=57497 RepID=UPI001FDF8321|nr:transposase [Deinococcus radiopugnans]
MGKQRKTWSPELKEQIVLAVLRGEQPVAELARQHGVAESLIGASNRPVADQKSHRTRNARCQRIKRGLAS